MHVYGRQAVDPLKTPPRNQDSAKKARQEAAVSRSAGASARAIDTSKQQKGRERAARDAPPAKKPRGPVSAAKLKLLLPGSRVAGMHDIA